MVADIGTVIAGLINAIEAFLTPTANESTGSFLSATAIASLAALFAVPITIGVVRKVTKLVKSARG